LFGVDSEGCEGRLEGSADGCDIAVASHLGYETAAGAEGSVDSCQHCVLAGDAGDPVESGIGKDSVELMMVRERGCVVVLDVKVAFASGGQHGRRGVDAGDDGSGGG
jgi:hypothetical protein